MRFELIFTFCLGELWSVTPASLPTIVVVVVVIVAVMHPVLIEFLVLDFFINVTTGPKCIV